MPRWMASTFRARPASERPAPRPVIRSTGCPSRTAATALDVVVFFCSCTSRMPRPTASTACARLMAGPRVKSAVPGAMRQSRTPATGSPAMPISTGTTSHRAVWAIRQTLVRRAARFSATARVTLLSVWLTPCATTPLSAQSTSTARWENSSFALPVRAAASSSTVSSAPSPPSGFARLAQWACAAARAASSGGVMAAQRAASSVSVMVSPICFRRSGKTLRQGRARPV